MLSPAMIAADWRVMRSTASRARSHAARAEAMVSRLFTRNSCDVSIRLSITTERRRLSTIAFPGIGPNRFPT
jgi:hypothetical protein